MIKEIKAAVTIPVMAKARIGHFVEAQILEAVGIDYIDESEVRGQARGVRLIGCARGARPAVGSSLGVLLPVWWHEQCCAAPLVSHLPPPHACPCP